MTCIARAIRAWWDRLAGFHDLWDQPLEERKGEDDAPLGRT